MMVNMIIILYKITRELIKYFLTCLLALHDNETFSQTTGIAFSRNLSLGKPGGGAAQGDNHNWETMNQNMATRVEEAWAQPTVRETGKHETVLNILKSDPWT